MNPLIAPARTLYTLMAVSKVICGRGRLTSLFGFALIVWVV